LNRNHSCRSFSKSKLRIALYSHDTMGLGHIRRNQLISHALSVSVLDPSIFVICGTPEATSFSLPASADLLVLPSFKKELSGEYRSKNNHLSVRELAEVRSKTIRAAVEGFAPDVFIVDKVPRGALRELDPTLGFLQMSGSTLCILGLRDVLDEPKVVQDEWHEAENEHAIRDYFDAVWIYGDRSVYHSTREYGFSEEILKKVSYTGYQDQRVRLKFFDRRFCLQGYSIPSEPYILCLVGGGQDGAYLAETFVQSELPREMKGVLVTGPFLPERSAQKIREIVSRNAKFMVMDFVSETAPLVKNAVKVIGMGGYNTVCEVLSFEKPALIIPRIVPRKEQLIRAERLQRQGFIEVLQWENVSTDALASWIRKKQAPPQVHGRIDFRGLDRIRDSLAGMVENAFGVRSA
jgi:predicted glycosyltransferase